MGYESIAHEAEDIYISLFFYSIYMFIFLQLYRMGMYGPEYVWILNPEAGTVVVGPNYMNSNLEKTNPSAPKRS